MWTPRQVAQARGLALALVFILGHSGAVGAIPAAPSGQSYFFATRDACHASGVFRRQECAMAFANALSQLRDRAPTYKSVVECRLRFALCEPRRDRPGYSPVGIGVEIVLTAHGARGAPAMAVEAPGAMFPLVPLNQAYSARPDTPDYESARLDPVGGVSLPTDRFEPFAKHPQISAQFSFYSPASRNDAARPPAETPEQRRARLRAAPFVE